MCCSLQKVQLSEVSNKNMQEILFVQEFKKIQENLSLDYDLVLCIAEYVVCNFLYSSSHV